MSKYTGDPLVDFLNGVSARTGFQHVVGDDQMVRRNTVRGPVIWKHPRDRLIIEAHTVTERDPETEPFAQITETLEMVVTGSDFADVRAKMIHIWRTAFTEPSIDEGGRSYVAAVSYGEGRLPRANEPVPSEGVTLIDLIKLQWLAPRQEAYTTDADSIGLVGQLADNGTIIGTVTVP